MINYKIIKESDPWRCPENLGWVTGEYYSLVGVVAYINYNEKFVGEIKHFSNLEDAREEYSKLCDIFNVAEEEVFNV